MTAQQREQARLRQAAYRAKDPARARATTLRWRERNKEHVKALRDKNNAKNQAKLDALKAHPCVDCGVEYPPCVMDFDHVRGQKKYPIRAGYMARRDLAAELAKCDLRCANCHRLRHMHERQK